MRKRLMELNPHSFRRIVSTLLEVNGRGYWETDAQNIAQLQDIYQEIEDRIEGRRESLRAVTDICFSASSGRGPDGKAKMRSWLVVTRVIL
jgi:cobalamin biosynthesis Mg chelatase CobN